MENHFMFLSPLTDLCRTTNGKLLFSCAGICCSLLLWIYEWWHFCSLQVGIAKITGGGGHGIYAESEEAKGRESRIHTFSGK